MFGFHFWDLLIIAFFWGIAALITGLIVWAVRSRPTKVVYVPVYMPTPPTQQPYQEPGQPGTPHQDAGE